MRACAIHFQIGEELRSRGVVRTASNPNCDLAEHLFCAAFGGTQDPNAQRGFGVTEPDETRFQNKGRRVPRRNTSRQLSATYNLTGGHFDILACVIPKMTSA